MKRTVCLNMIVKNDNQVIRRCLHSVKDLIDYWVIVDIGSEDGTKEIIQDCLREIPGEFHEKDWDGFAHHRHEALDASRSKGDYLLFIDANDRLVFFEGFFMPELEDDIYFVLQREKTGDPFKQNYSFLFVKNDIWFQKKGGVHPFLRSNKPKNVRILSHVIKDGMFPSNKKITHKKNMKKKLTTKVNNRTFTIPADLYNDLQSSMSQQEMSLFITEAIRNELNVRKGISKKNGCLMESQEDWLLEESKCWQNEESTEEW